MSTRAAFLKSSTNAAHRAVEARLLALRPFAGRDRYGLFLLAQHRFHRHVEPFYRSSPLAEGAQASRLALIEADLRDLGMAPAVDKAAVATDLSVPAAAGWLYVAEGAKLGGAVLYKAAGRLGLDAGFGARHLAEAGEGGRARAWRRFTAALDALALTPGEDAAAAVAAGIAFRCFAAEMELAFAGREAA